jgi:hypothetical protein
MIVADVTGHLILQIDANTQLYLHDTRLTLVFEHIPSRPVTILLEAAFANKALLD